MTKFKDRIDSCLIPLLVKFASIAEDDSVLKPMNYQLMLKTRSTKMKVRKASLNAAEAIFTKLGEDTVPLLPETMPFLAEALEGRKMRTK